MCVRVCGGGGGGGRRGLELCLCDVLGGSKINKLWSRVGAGRGVGVRGGVHIICNRCLRGGCQKSPISLYVSFFLKKKGLSF